MSDCKSIDPLITPYVDGDIDADAKGRVDDHVRRCPPCHSRVSAERAVRELMRTRRAEISAGAASESLRARCAALRDRPGDDRSPEGSRSFVGARGSSRAGFSRAIRPLAIAATVVLVAGGVFLYEATDKSTRVLAAELTADHVKCFGVVNSLVGTNANAAAVEQVMSDVFGWQMHVPEQGGGELQLVGARPCLYARGKAAHLMYRHHGQAMSLFMLPQLSDRANNPAHANLETVDVMGHEAAVWSRDGRTFVLIAKEPEAELQRVASEVQASLH